MSREQFVKTILILAANPEGTTRLRLNEEVREIEAGLERSRYRNRFIVKHASAARPRDVRRAMLDYKPQIVHFCGHGKGQKGLVLEDESGKPKLVSTEALANLFELFSDQVECVLLNACYSEVQARGIAQHINSVIGMNQAIGNRAAIEFAVSFYDALGAGESFEFAFRLGCNAMQLAGIAENQIPVLIPKPEFINEAIYAESGESRRSINPSPTEQVVPQSNSSGTRSRVFICSEGGVEQDEVIVQEMLRMLSQAHDVFMRTKVEIQQSDFVIAFLSAHSVYSERVIGEVETAHRLSQEQGLPRILPVRVAYRQPFVHPLNTYLNHLDWALWDSPTDTPRLLKELQQAIAGGSLPIATEEAKIALLHSQEPEAIPRPYPMAQLVNLDQPEGTMNPESKFYVERPADAIALQEMRQGGVMVIKAPRQMGKSSLLVRTVQAAKQMNKQVVFLDFQLLDKTALASSDLFYQQFCAWISSKLRLPNRVEEYWQRRRAQGNLLCCTHYLEDWVLAERSQPLVLAMDEVETVFGTSFRSEFFGMLRSWYNNRSIEPNWRLIDLVLVTSTEPYLWIENLEQSPFNVAQEIELIDFTAEQVADLNQRHGNPLTQSQTQQMMTLLNGHPYLVRRALYLVASERMTAAQMLETATDERGAFGDHLRYYLFRLNSKPELVAVFLQVIRDQKCTDEQLVFRLQSAGLVRLQGQAVVPRCQLYAAYFQEHLRG